MKYRIQNQEHILYHISNDILIKSCFLFLECKKNSDCNQLYPLCEDGICQFTQGKIHDVQSISNKQNKWQYKYQKQIHQIEI